MWITTFLPLAMLVMLIFILQYYVFVLSRAARITGNFLPGPKSLPIIGAALEFGRTPVDLLKNLVRVTKEYGYVCRAWMGPHLFVLVADPVFIEPFFSSTVNIRKSMNYEFMNPWLGTGLLTSFGKKWKSRRKIITPTFHFKILEGFVDSFNTQGNTLIKKLKKHAGGPAFDIYKYINLYTLDVICDAAMGLQLNVQDDKNCEYVAALHEASEIIVKRSMSPWYFPEFIFNMSPLGRRQKALIKTLHNMSYKVIKERKMELSNNGKEGAGSTETDNDIGQKKRLAFLDMLLHYDKSGGNLSLEDIREEVDTFMFEGHDTTSSGLSFTLWSLAENPACQQKAYEELYEIFGTSDREATTEDLTKMKYLECVIKETLRLFPSVPFFLRELDEDVKIEGVNFVAGTTVLLAPFIMHKHPQYFPNPEKFDPERFTPENTRGRHPYAYVPFSAGPRNCIGQKFAMMEMKAAVSKILRNYKLSSGGRENVYSVELILRTVGGIHIKLENRK
ncbi:hypothetical protein R5R35_010203 [Gryllus longicercus]|uniref:Cytochrome P450 n=1 Tax=Gryllus longicercus TaxID=2509291 RepID=A0AAN9VZA5_9ORTH